jgi:hypothetical protein
MLLPVRREARSQPVATGIVVSMSEGCIECYTIEEAVHLRIVHWHKLRWIGHPTPSRLPPSPQEGPTVSGIPEASGRRRDRGRKAQSDQSLARWLGGFPEGPDFECARGAGCRHAVWPAVAP